LRAVTRDESGAQNFRVFRENMKTKQKYENKNDILLVEKQTRCRFLAK
jgi:hypothetical protein